MAKLLEKVKDQNSAKKYKTEIKNEVSKLKESQVSGGESFALLSDKEKKVFIQKFQNNRNHCGNVTRVMQERNRILLNPEMPQPVLDSHGISPTKTDGLNVISSEHMFALNLNGAEIWTKWFYLTKNE